MMWRCLGSCHFVFNSVPTCHIKSYNGREKKEEEEKWKLNLNVNSWNWRWVARPGAVHHDVYLRKSSASRKTLSSGPAPQQGLMPDNRMEKQILKMKKKLSEGFLLNKKTEPDNLKTWSVHSMSCGPLDGDLHDEQCLFVNLFWLRVTKLHGHILWNAWIADFH